MTKLLAVNYITLLISFIMQKTIKNIVYVVAI